MDSIILQVVDYIKITYDLERRNNGELFIDRRSIGDDRYRTTIFLQCKIKFPSLTKSLFNDIVFSTLLDT